MCGALPPPSVFDLWAAESGVGSPSDTINSVPTTTYASMNPAMTLVNTTDADLNYTNPSFTTQFYGDSLYVWPSTTSGTRKLIRIRFVESTPVEAIGYDLPVESSYAYSRGSQLMLDNGTMFSAYPAGTSTTTALGVMAFKPNTAQILQVNIPLDVQTYVSNGYVSPISGNPVFIVLTSANDAVAVELDKDTGALVSATVTTFPSGAVVTTTIYHPPTGKVFALVSGSSTLYTLDPATLVATAVATLPSAGDSIVVVPTGKLFVTTMRPQNINTNRVVVVDAITYALTTINAQLSTTDTAVRPSFPSISSDGYVFYTGGAKLLWVDYTTLAANVTPITSNANTGACAPDGKVYCGNRNTTFGLLAVFVTNPNTPSHSWCSNPPMNCRR